MIGLVVAIFLISFLNEALYDQIFRFGITRAYEVLIQGEYHRLFTGMFLHGSLIHLFFNAYSLYVIGSSVEPVFGSLRFAIICLLGGLLGSVLSVVLRSPENYLIGSVGASGAVFAGLSAMGIYFYRHQALMGQAGKRALQQIVVMMGLNLMIGLFSALDSSAVRIDNWGHIGGLIGGAILAWFLGPVFLLSRDPQDPLLLHLQDSRPLKNHYWVISAYSILLLVILAVFTVMAR